jgi:DNA-binding NarL/FixJ family response regulator
MSADRTGQRVVAADDDVLLREGVAGLLERAGFEIAGQAGDAAELLRVVRDQQPQLMIVDIRMPPKHETDGLDAARVIRRELPEVAILVLSAHAEAAEAMELLATGRGIGYLLKSRVTKVEDFVETVDRVIGGGSVVDPALVQELVQVRHREDRLARLTEREREVLALVAREPRTPGSRSGCGSPRARWKSTCAASSRSCAYRRRPTIIVGCSRCSRFSTPASEANPPEVSPRAEGR